MVYFTAGILHITSYPDSNMKPHVYKAEVVAISIWHQVKVVTMMTMTQQETGLFNFTVCDSV